MKIGFMGKILNGNKRRHCGKFCKEIILVNPVRIDTVSCIRKDVVRRVKE